MPRYSRRRKWSRDPAQAVPKGKSWWYDCCPGCGERNIPGTRGRLVRKKKGVARITGYQGLGSNRFLDNLPSVRVDGRYRDFGWGGYVTCAHPYHDPPEGRDDVVQRLAAQAARDGRINRHDPEGRGARRKAKARLAKERRSKERR
jgi:hypothetical protein